MTVNAIEASSWDLRGKFEVIYMIVWIILVIVASLLLTVLVLTVTILRIIKGDTLEVHSETTEVHGDNLEVHEENPEVHGDSTNETTHANIEMTLIWTLKGQFNIDSYKILVDTWVEMINQHPPAARPRAPPKMDWVLMQQIR